MDFSSDDHVFTVFKQLVEEKGFKIDLIDEEDLIHLSTDDYEMTVSLDNLRKQYDEVKDDSCIKEFVDAIVTTDDDLPGWEEAMPNILPSLFPADFEFEDYVNFPITEEFNMIFVYDTVNKKTWINEEQLETWGIDNKTIVATAYENLDRALDTAKLEIELIEDKKLGYFEAEDETLKSVLILSKKLKSKVGEEIGWPVVAVIPVRDFCYIFAESDFDFFAERLGSTVIEEFQNSGYPITTELLQCSDDGIKAIAKFELSEEDSE